MRKIAQPMDAEGQIPKTMRLLIISGLLSMYNEEKSLVQVIATDDQKNQNSVLGFAYSMDRRISFILYFCITALRTGSHLG